MNLQQGDRMIIFLPLFHGYAFGMMCNCICFDTIMCLMRDYNTDKLLNSIQKYKITHLPLVPPILVAILKHPMLSNFDFSSVKEILCGALPLPLDVSFLPFKYLDISRCKIDSTNRLYRISQNQSTFVFRSRTN